MATVAKAKAGVKGGSDPRVELRALLAARTPLTWITTTEERRVELQVAEIAGKIGVGKDASGKPYPYETVFWDVATGARNSVGEAISGVGDTGMRLDLLILEVMFPASLDRPIVWVLRDVENLLDNPRTTRALRSLAGHLSRCLIPRKFQTLVVISTAEVPSALQNEARALHWSLPDRETITAMISGTAGRMGMPLTPADLDALVSACAGLGAHEIEQALAVSRAYTGGRFDPERIALEKRAAVERSGALKWYDPDPRGLDAIGGLGEAKKWLRARKAALTTKARDFGLPVPKGILILGFPGTGKSMLSKAIGAAWGLPVLRFDPGATKSKYVGDSEKSFREALRVASAVGDVVLWIDEIEKAFGAGGADSHQVEKDALGTLLTWMSEPRKGVVFLVATANNIAGLPPELLRKGRFDEIFYVDLPDAAERAEILAASLRGLPVPRDPGKYDLETLARRPELEQFSGAELAAAIEAGLYSAFDRGEELTEADILAAAKATNPLAKTRSEALAELRGWAEKRARPAALRGAATNPVSEQRVIGGDVFVIEDDAETGA